MNAMTDAVKVTPRPPTDFGKDVLNSLSVISTESGAIDQRMLRYFIGLSPSYLVTDITTNLPVSEPWCRWPASLQCSADAS
jgi:hypothetical protein